MLKSVNGNFGFHALVTWFSVRVKLSVVQVTLAALHLGALLAPVAIRGIV